MKRQAVAIFPKSDHVTVQHQLLFLAYHSYRKFRQESIRSPLYPKALRVFYVLTLIYEGSASNRRFGIEIYGLNLLHATRATLLLSRLEVVKLV